MVEPNRKLGEFLRSRRAKLDPEDVGIATTARRRTAGLRREEVARLAGISAEWYVKLEQGRAVSPSTETIEALGAALRLGDVERRHLRSLASLGTRAPFAREIVPEPLRHIVGSLRDPAYVTGRRWDVLAWNAAAAGLLGDFGALPEEDRNILLFTLVLPHGRRLFGGAWETEARRQVSLFRATADLWRDDPAFDGLVARLRAGCPEFAGWWAHHDIAAPGSGLKTLHLPDGRTYRCAFASFQANDDPALKLALYVPAATPTPSP